MPMNNTIQKSRRHPIAYLLSIIFLTVGVVLGAMSVSRLTPDQKRDLTSYLDQYIHSFEAQEAAVFADGGDPTAEPPPKPVMLRRSVMSQAKVLLAAYVLGLTVFCAPAVLMVVLSKGFLIGFSVGFLVDEYLGRGALFSLAAVLPHNLILIPAVVFLSVNALAFAWDTIKGSGRTGQPVYLRLAGYTMWAAAMGVVFIGASFVETYIAPILIKLVVGYL